MTIIELARCMRLHARLPLQFWEDVVDIVVYLINIWLSSSLYVDIPKESSIKKIEQSLRQNQIYVPLLDML